MPVSRGESPTEFELTESSLNLEHSPLQSHATTRAADEGSSNYLTESVLSAVKSRVGWLGLFLVGLWAAAFVIDAFEHMLQRNVELAHFVPLIIGHGGNAGSQAVGQVIRALAAREVDPRNTRRSVRVVLREALVGLLCGCTLGLVVFVVGTATHLVSLHVGAIVAIALPLVSLWANLCGALLPLIAARLGSNPALTSAPLMTTIIDSSGLVIYFMVAQVYYSSRMHEFVDRHHSIPGLGPRSGKG